MAERKFTLTEKQVGELWRAYDECSDADTKIRYQAVRLYGTAYPLQTILEVTGCSLSSLREGVRAYRRAGLGALTDHRGGGNSAKLTSDQQAEIEGQLLQFTPLQLLGAPAHTPSGPFWTVADLQNLVHHGYGVQYQSRISYYNLFHRCGFSYQRTEKVFKSQRPLELAAFQEQVEKK